MKPCNFLDALLIATLFTLLHPHCVDAGLTSYLPSMGYLNPFAWFWPAKPNHPIKAEINRTDNGTHMSVGNSSTTPAPALEVSSKPWYRELPFNTTKQPNKTTNQPVSVLPGTITDLFTTKKPKKVRILKKKGKVYETPASENVTSNSQQTQAFDDHA